MKKLLLAIATTAILAIACTGCQGDYYHSNRCVMRDTNHTFTHAKVIYGGHVEELEVVGWMDYQSSDSIQLWVKDPSSPSRIRVVYTHLNNVVLENRNPEYLPKFNKFF